MNTPNLMISDKDIVQLRLLLERNSTGVGQDGINWVALEEEIERAKVVPYDQIPADVVIMHSRVRIVDMRTGEQRVFQIVFPHEANYAEGKISVLAPIGMALLGCSAGTEVEWNVPSGRRRLLVEAVEHQPESVRKKSAA